MSQTYLKSSRNHPNFSPICVDAPVFRFYGRILVPDFSMTGEDGQNLLDFGCGQGSAVNYFSSLGFNAYGVDVLEGSIETAKNRYPQINERFQTCSPDPNLYSGFNERKYSVITAIQSLYYVNDEVFDHIMKSLYEILEPGGVIYATMVSTQSQNLFDYSTSIGQGLREVSFKYKRYSVDSIPMNFTESEDHMLEKFKLFKKVHLGFYSDKFRDDEPSGHHYTFCGIKD
jgi:cyclopropane fatty-acyl-phospholipid synthase-like methyltransferase